MSLRGCLCSQDYGWDAHPDFFFLCCSQASADGGGASYLVLIALAFRSLRSHTKLPHAPPAHLGSFSRVFWTESKGNLNIGRLVVQFDDDDAPAWSGQNL